MDQRKIGAITAAGARRFNGNGLNSKGLIQSPQGLRVVYVWRKAKPRGWQIVREVAR